jgi:hypothetical protein
VPLTHIIAAHCCCLQGYLVGNGCTDQAYDGNAQVPFAVGKSLISTSLYRRTQAACGGSYWDAKEGSRCVCVLCWGERLGWVYGDMAGVDLGHMQQWRGQVPVCL